MVVKKAKTILVPLDSFLYLHEKCRLERVGEPLTEKGRKMLERNFERFEKNGAKEIMDYDLGGCRGPVKNGFEEGRWTSWSCEDMKKILDGKGLSYKDGSETEYIAVAL